MLGEEEAGKFLCSDVYIACHHGANDKRCNEVKLLKLVNPQFVIFSSDLWESYKHPRREVIEAFLRLASEPHCRLKAMETWHTICAGGFEDPQDAFAGLFAVFDNKSYGLLATNRGLFCTITQGDIQFQFKKGLAAIAPPDCKRGTSECNSLSDHILNTLSSEDHIIRRYIDTKGPKYIASHCVALSLSDLIKEVAGGGIDRKVINALQKICRFVKDNQKIRYVDFSDNTLSNEILLIVIETIRENRHLSAFKMRNISWIENEKSTKEYADYRIRLRAAWNNRGLDIDPDQNLQDTDLLGSVN